jgi:hypothetical protein
VLEGIKTMLPSLITVTKSSQDGFFDLDTPVDAKDATALEYLSQFHLSFDT